MTFTGTHLTPLLRPVQSLLAFATKTAPEVPELLCVDPVETAADKLSALAWRTATRDRSADKDDPSVIRHLHDLAALAPRVRGNPGLTSLTRKLLQIDARERAKMPEADSLTMLSAMLPAIVSDPLWRKEYEEFVDAVSFGPDDARITFDQAVAVGQALVATVEAA